MQLNAAVAVRITVDAGVTATESEPNNRESQANVVDLGDDGQVTIQGVSTSDRDKDFVRISPTSSGILNVGVNANGGQFAKLEVNNGAGTEVFETQLNDEVNSGSFEVQAGATYLLRLRRRTRALRPTWLTLC